MHLRFNPASRSGDSWSTRITPFLVAPRVQDLARPSWLPASVVIVVYPPAHLASNGRTFAVLPKIIPTRNTPACGSMSRNNTDPAGYAGYCGPSRPQCTRCLCGQRQKIFERFAANSVRPPSARSPSRGKTPPAQTGPIFEVLNLRCGNPVQIRASRDTVPAIEHSKIHRVSPPSPGCLTRFFCARN